MRYNLGDAACANQFGITVLAYNNETTWNAQDNIERTKRNELGTFKRCYGAITKRSVDDAVPLLVAERSDDRISVDTYQERDLSETGLMRRETYGLNKRYLAQWPTEGNGYYSALQIQLMNSSIPSLLHYANVGSVHVVPTAKMPVMNQGYVDRSSWFVGENSQCSNTLAFTIADGAGRLLHGYRDEQLRTNGVSRLKLSALSEMPVMAFLM